MNLTLDQLNYISGAHYGIDLTPPPQDRRPPAGDAGPSSTDIKESGQPPPRAATPGLNRLMQNISRETYSEVTSDTLKQLSDETAALGKSGRKELLALDAAAKDAQNALAKIGELKVKDILGGNVEKLFKNAADKQFELAEKLRDLANSPKYSGEKFADYRFALNELSLKCDSRASEIMTLYMEVKTFGDMHAIGDESEFSSSNAGELIKGMSGSMHDNDRALRTLEKEVGDIETNLAGISTKRSLSPEDVEPLLANAKKLGDSLKSMNASETMDAAIYAKLTAHLDTLREKLENLVQKAVLNVANSTLRQAGSLNMLGRTLASRITGNDRIFPNVGRLLNLLNRISSEGAREIGDFDALRDCLTSDELLNEVETIRYSQCGDLFATDDLSLDGFFESIGYPIKPLVLTIRIVDEIKGRLNNPVGDKLSMTTGEDIRNAFSRDDRLSVILETRLNGANEADVDPWLCDRNVISQKKLGSGNVNTVFQVTYRMPDGSTKDYVFKPDLSGRCGLEELSIGVFKTYSTTQQAVKHNTATCDVAKLLNLDRLTGTNYATVHDGKYGLLMEMAPGKDAAQVKKDISDQVKKNISENLKRFSDPQVVGSLARELNDLQWLDLATGQGDRHTHNYMLHFGPDNKTPKVTAIDNDMCFTSYLVGLGKFNINHDPRRYTNFMNYLKKMCGENGYRILKRKIDRNSGIVDVAKASAEELSALVRVFGFKAVSVPRQMSRGLCDKLKKLTDPELDDFAKKLNRNIDSQDAVTATIRRLKEMRDLAMRYEQEGRVVEDNDWAGKRVLQRELATTATHPKLSKTPNSTFGEAIYVTSGMLRRDFYNIIGNNLKT